MSEEDKLQKTILTYQKNEITEYHIYRKLAKLGYSPENRETLESIASDELRHYDAWKEVTHKTVAPSRWKIWKYYLLARLFGFTFAVKLMERGEEDARENYAKVVGAVSGAEEILQDEVRHEESLIGLLEEDRLRYVGSVVLGLNDALVELTGALAGFTFALQNTALIALTGSITGFAAALSMGASEYLSTKAEDSPKRPIKASIYTGMAYLLTVVVLILPYLLIENPFICLASAFLVAVIVILFFNYYISVTKDESFFKRFFEMVGISFGVAAISFIFGYLVRSFFDIEI